jgi:hypothetical protein
VKIASQDLQAYSDAATVIPVTTTASNRNIQGLVSEDWKGFDAALGTPGATSATTQAYGVLGRGTEIVKVTTWGYHPSALIDNTSGVTITNEIELINATNAGAAGKLMGVTPAVASIGAICGAAVLPASGIGSSLGAGTLTAASQTQTLTGTPAVGDTISVTVQVPYAGTPFNLPYTPGVAQTATFTTPALTAAQATSVTTAAAACVAYFNAQPAYAKYYLASNSAGVITHTVVSNPFFITFANGGFMTVNTAGTVGNSLTITGAATGGTTSTVGAGTFASGAGYVGTAPVFLELAR